MDVLFLGLPRTGTQSMAEALPLLGYGKVYHMKDNFIRGDHAFWARVMDAKYAGLGEPVTRKDFDALFEGEFKATSDYPAAMFPEELIAAYPSAKVILSVRDEDSWVKSMEDTVLHMWNAKTEASPPETAPANDSGPVNHGPPALHEMVRKIQTYAWGGDFETNGRQLFHEHNERVRQLMENRKEDFLEYRVAEGWEPLCRFLGKEIPGEAFPEKMSGQSIKLGRRRPRK
ncbi:uncharacterized protein N7483_005389 [Penicillium malachiteum]|uniref:uncharacterized protein n=1 Tax=Penicillium malachiteum TaxID=1324776 RepID=UPI0025491744|nr:uncharacterized protein N7483_005389 [Penicillium malachiteum]KAJ5730881.1 hypothetical protein N7483_005389 [Penicillium malachiteum]